MAKEKFTEIMKRALVFFLILLLSVSFVSAQYVSRGPGGPPLIDKETLSRTGKNILDNPFFYVLLIISVLWIAKIKRIRITTGIVGIALLIGWIFLFGNSVESIQPDIQEKWQEEYQISRMKAGISDDYLKETDYFDIDSPVIQEIANKIRANAYNTEDAVQRALDYVYYNVDYDMDESDDVCFKATGSTVIKSGHGQCDTQTLSVVTILRSLGIAVRPVGGCYTSSTFCDLKYSFFSDLGKQLRRPRNQPIKIEEGAEWVGRKGYLHAFAEVWLPSNSGGEWIIIEPTAGRIMRGTCLQYHTELYPETIKELCVSTNITYAKACASDDYKTLGAI